MAEPEWILIAAEDMNSREGEIISKAAFTNNNWRNHETLLLAWPIFGKRAVQPIHTIKSYWGVGVSVLLQS